MREPHKKGVARHFGSENIVFEVAIVTGGGEGRSVHSIRLAIFAAQSQKELSCFEDLPPRFG
jgi:hypothetical protein